MRAHIVSHTHWDREWYLTYEQFRLRLVGLVDRLLDMMETRPEYKYFHLDGQTIVLEDYLELRPHNEARLRKLIAEGRILIGPWYDMPDEFLVSGESIVRNIALGHHVAKRFGAVMPVGYLPDLFGHVAQMPQILRHFGLDNAILWRGFGGRQAEYWWEAPDGSRVLMMHLPPEGYCNATRVHLDPDQMIDRATRAIRIEKNRTAVGEMLLMNGVDHVEPHPVIPALARQLTEALGFEVSHSTLPAYVDAVRTAIDGNGTGASLEVIAGELRGGEDYANLLPGVFSARVYLKQANARIQTLLEKRAEPLATFAWMLGAAYPEHELAYAWRTLLQNHPHDSICGCSIDAVHQENMTRFARAEQVARAVVQDAADVIARGVPASKGDVLRLVALNTTGHAHTGTMEATIDVPYESDEPRRTVDPGALDARVRFWPREARLAALRSHDGRAIPVQVLSEEESRPLVMSRYETPWILRARRLHLAWQADVPALGYACFDLEFGAAAAPAADSPPLRVEERSARNRFVEIAIGDDGAVTVTDLRSGVRYEGCGELEDVGDVGDEYNYSPPASNERITSAAARNVRVTRLHAGPVRATFRIDLTLPLPASATVDRTARSTERVETPITLDVSLDADSPRIHWRVVVDNRTEDHRLRILFPAGAREVTDVRAETAFGVVRRPARRDATTGEIREGSHSQEDRGGQGGIPERSFPELPELPELPVDPDPSQAGSRCEIPVSYGPTGSFTESGDHRAGAIVFGEGLVEYEAVEDEGGRVSRIGLTLLRSVGFLSREDLALRPSGHAGPGLPTPGAQCPGRHEYRLAFEPRVEPPSSSALFARAASFMAPPHVTPAVGAGGTLPASGAFITIQPGTAPVVLSACHRSSEAADAVTLRVFNPDDDEASIGIGTRATIRAAERVNFLEQPQSPLAVDGSVQVVVGPQRIETVRLSLDRRDVRNE